MTMRSSNIQRARRLTAGALALLAGVLAGCEREPAPVEVGVAAGGPRAAPANGVRYIFASGADAPAVRFEFPEPLSDYKGTASRVVGEMVLPGDGVLDAMTLRVDVETASVSLGEAEIDANAHSAMFMGVEKHPVSTFVLTGVDPPGVVLGAKPAIVTIQGDFSLKGVTVPIEAAAALTRGKDGVVTLDARWTLDLLRSFGIPGPGQGEASERVELRASLAFKPGVKPADAGAAEPGAAPDQAGPK